ncbi:C6 finger domain-containing protein [Hypomontagnella monticulosa]|nr:C6 finger domain-containing protein [Hypomontagnella monticulosa]
MMASGSNLLPPPRVPKLGHKKSMFGCQRCRTRRVKCNEAKPVCHNCSRHGLPCIYDRDVFVKAPEKKSCQAQISPVVPEESDPPEGRIRRMLEARLMHQYLVETGTSIAADERTVELFSRTVPKVAFGSDGLLYTMYTVSALHLASLGRNEELEGGVGNVANTYFSMAIREHNKEISQLSKETADAVCLTSCLIRSVAHVQLRGRNRQPYTPPWQWLVLAQTSRSTFQEAWERVGPDPESVAFQLIMGTSHIHEMGELPIRRHFHRLQHLMDQSNEFQVTERWDPEIQDAYERTLSYLCTALNLADEEGSSGNVFRMLIMFPMFADRNFINLVQAGSPRALVVLAHYFALLVRFEDVWWIGSVGTDEVRAIAGALPDEWQGLLDWPLKAVQK